MTPKEYILTYRKAATSAESQFGISADFLLAQTALESGWGSKAPGFNFGGIKDTDGINGNEQLITTTEYLRTSTAKFPAILSKIFVPAKKLWKYVVRDYFRKYNSAEEYFVEHCKFFLKNKRYAEALKVKHDPYLFAAAVAKAGYATDPNYAKSLSAVINTVRNTRIKNNI